MRVRQIIFNLLGNAVKFTETGEIRIDVTTADEDSDSATLRFAVTDTGIGIPKNRTDRLFQAFSQVDGSATRRYGGTGLGLSIVKQLAEMMGGRVGVQSKEGQGSMFWFTAVFEKQDVPKLLHLETPTDKGNKDLISTPISFQS